MVVELLASPLFKAAACCATALLLAAVAGAQSLPPAAELPPHPELPDPLVRLNGQKLRGS